MSRLKTALQNDVQLLAFARDELALQAHLLKGDLKQRWDALEQDYARLKEHVARAEVATDAARDDIEAASRLLVETLRNGFASIKRAFQS
jgi:hypothetical protein